MYKLVCQKPAPFLAALNNNLSVFIVLRIYNFEALLTKQPLLEELTAYMWPPSIHLSRLLSHTYCCMQFSVAGGDGGGARRPTAAVASGCGEAAWLWRRRRQRGDATTKSSSWSEFFLHCNSFIISFYYSLDRQKCHIWLHLYVAVFEGLFVASCLCQILW